MRIPMAADGNDGAFPSSIQMRNTYQKWYKTPDPIGLFFVYLCNFGIV